MKNKKSSWLKGVVLFSVLLAGSCLLADSASKKELFFGPIVSGLEGTGLVASKSQNVAVPLLKTSLAAGQQETLHFSLDTAQTSLNTIRGKDYVRIEGLKPSGNPGEPMLPFKSFVISLPLNSSVWGVSAGNIFYRPVLNKLDIAINPMPVAHTQNEKRTVGNEGQTANVNKSYSKCKSCDSETFLPGELVSYVTGRGSNNRLVFIKFFPFQYIPITGQTIIITNAEIVVNYQLGASK